MEEYFCEAIKDRNLLLVNPQVVQNWENVDLSKPKNCRIMEKETSLESGKKWINDFKRMAKDTGEPNLEI